MPPTPANRPDRDESPVRDRGDACPGALRLHTADDGALARVRVPAGLLDARQAYALADAAERLGDGALDITSRGNLQLRGLDPVCAGELAELLDAADLLPAPAHERIRNMVASPLSGLDGRGHLDVRPLVRELDTLLCAAARATALSGRFLFALDDGRGDMAELAADVMLLAEAGDGVPGAPVAGGAGAPGAPGGPGAPGRARVRVVAGEARVRVRPEDGARMLLLAAEAFLDAADASGARPWRVRELPPEHALSTRDLLRRAAAADLPAEPAPEPPAAPAGPGPAEPPAPGAHARDGADAAVCAGVVLGRMSAAQVRSLARVAERHGTGELRVTPWRSVVLPGVAAAHLPELAAAGLVTGAGSPWHGVSACTGRPGCGKALADVRADATALAAAGSGGTPVHWSGCGRRCGHPHGAHVDLVATGEGRYTLAVVPANRPAAPAVPATEAATASATEAVPEAPPGAVPANATATAHGTGTGADHPVRHDLDVPELAGALAAARGGRPLHHRPATTK
ncbi:precorrin-3B synthase [Streptomyces zhihengii]|uniref:precorrin-3B synthase n=1 Tax=Streptomyces zhihengii TaxID=1818004 RepID=UPI00368842DF